VNDPRFACDAMLGSLARWLRFAGYDTCYKRDVVGAALAARARAEGRWLLTCDRGLASAAGPRVLLLQRRGAAAQVEEIRARLELSGEPERFFTLCAECGGELEQVAREAVAARVPPYVAAHADRFRACPGCGRVYWPGTHVGRIAQRLEELFLTPAGS
jgi:uncharacterized protein